MPPCRRWFLPVVVLAAVAGAGLTLAAPAANAAGLRMTVERPHFTCERNGLSFSHAAYRPGSMLDSKPVLPCCDGQIGCAQFLSTNTVLQPAHRWHS